MTSTVVIIPSVPVSSMVRVSSHLVRLFPTLAGDHDVEVVAIELFAISFI
jgi:hypothetical protein